MPNNRSTNEDYQAGLAQRRGTVAANIKDPSKKKAFIGAQGAGKDSDEELETSLARERNKQAAGIGE